ncbi:MAG: 23S rRNA (uracil(1939)-C(5))-methyltransferase RlmD [Anaerolineae bacterium]
MTQDESFELELTAMAHGGSALGRHDKRTIFVPYTIPGEIIEARILEDKGRVAFAEGVRLVEASADRVFPRCPHFGPGRCGGCQWQHIDYTAQTLLKQDILADQLERIGGFPDADVRAIIPSPVQWQYNHHMTLLPAEGNTLGFMSTQEGRVHPITECHILHPDLLALYETLDLDFNSFSRLRLQIGTDGATMLMLSVDNEEDVPELALDFATSVNLILPDNEPVNLIGDSHSLFTIRDHTFRVTAGSFIRPNVAQLATLSDLVLHLLDPTAKTAVLDLYGGVGLFSAALAPHVSLISLVESYPPAATDADENLAAFDHVDILEGTVEDALEALDDPYDAALLDPPLEGLSTDVVDMLAEHKIQRLVYISSDPATLARDAKRLVAQGYTLGAVQPIDLAPQTYYIDSVAVFDRQD